MTVAKTLTIAGSDSGGGAGIQADIKTFAAHGVHGSSAIVALTAQNTAEVRAIHDVPEGFIISQIDAVLEDIGADAVKIGMLSTSSIISTVAAALKKHKCRNIILDPVMVAASGAKLLEDSAIDALKRGLIPLADILTPNIPEAEILVGMDIATQEEVKQAAERILSLGCKAVLMKGGHLTGKEKVTDILFTDGKELIMEHPRLDGEGHGTGCTLSSAIAANLAKGLSPEDAVKKAVSYVHGALKHGYAVGSGNVVLNHLWQKS